MINFFEAEEEEVVQQFLKHGYYIFPLENSSESILNEIRGKIFEFSKEHLNLDNKIYENDFFNQTHKHLGINQLNDYKLKLMSFTSKNLTFHPNIYRSAKKYLNYIVGNEVCMQRNLNLSIQLPNDKSALLPIHTDVWSGNSPYEIVLWMPLVNCYKTKSMYVLPLEHSKTVFQNFSKYKDMDSESFYSSLEKQMIFLDVPKGHAVIFSHSILHGNRINEEPDTRWTFNIRFKAILSPYGTKDLGESFIPITLRPITRIGFNFELPKNLSNNEK